jgi:hypothetical protein
VKILNDARSYAAAISAAWHKSVEDTLEVAKLCAQADRELAAAAKAQMLQQLPFQAPTFSKLVKIGNDPRLHTAEMLPRLPASFSSMYEIALCSDPQLEQAIDSGMLHPGATREEIEAVRKLPARSKRATLPPFEDELAQEDEAPTSKIERVCFAELHVPHDFPDEQGEKLTEDLTRIAEAFGIELVRRLTSKERAEARYDKSLLQWWQRQTRVARKLARQRINVLKRDARRQNKKWAYAVDETEINCTDGWGRIVEVYEFLGLEDEVDDLRAKVESLTQPPDLPTILSERQSQDGIEFGRPYRDLSSKRLAKCKAETESEDVE